MANPTPTLGPDGYYRKVLSFDGRRYNIKGKTLEAFYRNWEAKKRELETGQKKAQTITVKDWCQTWYQVYVLPRDVEEKHKKSYERMIRLHILPQLGGCRLRDVTETALQQLLAAAAAGYSESMVKLLRVTLRQIFYRAYKNKLIPEDVSEDLALPQAAAGTHRAITPEERRFILQVAQTHFAGPWVLCILYLGLRPNETIALTWDDVDFESQTLRVTKALKSGSGKIGAPKSKAGIREIPIPDIYLPVLQAHYRRRGTPPNPALKKDGTPTARPVVLGDYQNTVFTQQTNLRPLTETALRGYWSSFARALDIAMGAVVFRNQIVESKLAPDLTPYCLRHTYCTDLQDAGVPINIAKYLMGHSSIEVTAKIYTHHTAQSGEIARRLINAAHPSEPTQK